VLDGNAVVHARHQAQDVAAQLESQGGPPASETQGKKIIALIAYIQRLGTDIYKDPADVGKALAMPADATATTEGAGDAAE